jgi:hypothetical protein
MDCLKRLRFTKGSRNALKKVDYDSVQHLKVGYLPPVFNGDVVFEFPSIRSLSASSQAGIMVGMDKRHDGHVWSRTSTSHIKSDMGLTFRSATCVGHLRCENQDCEYLSRVHRTSQVNEMEWDGLPLHPSKLDVNLLGSPPSYARFARRHPLALRPVRPGYIMSPVEIT